MDQLCNTLKKTWDLASKRIKHAIDLQSKYYDGPHRPVDFEMGQLVLSSTGDLRMKGTPSDSNEGLWSPLESSNK